MGILCPCLKGGVEAIRKNPAHNPCEKSTENAFCYEGTGGALVKAVIGPLFNRMMEGVDSRSFAHC
jgi:hypothetical protein